MILPYVWIYTYTICTFCTFEKKSGNIGEGVCSCSIRRCFAALFSLANITWNFQQDRARICNWIDGQSVYYLNATGQRNTIAASPSRLLRNKLFHSCFDSHRVKFQLSASSSGLKRPSLPLLLRGNSMASLELLWLLRLPVCVVAVWGQWLRWGRWSQMQWQRWWWIWPNLLPRCPVLPGMFVRGLSQGCRLFYLGLWTKYIYRL